MSVGAAVCVAVTFTWIGLVAGISFIEAPLKFRAPGVTIPIGLGIGRLVFRVVNSVEAVLGLVVVVTLVTGVHSPAATVALGLAVAALAVQLLVVRPALSRRSDAVLAGADAPRSRAHLNYLALEVVKFAALVVGGILVLAAG